MPRSHFRSSHFGVEPVRARRFHAVGVAMVLAAASPPELDMLWEPVGVVGVLDTIRSAQLPRVEKQYLRKRAIEVAAGGCVGGSQETRCCAFMKKL